MHRIIFTLLFTSLFVYSGYSQPIFTGEAVKNVSDPALSNSFNAYEVFELDAAGLYQFAKSKVDQVELILQLSNSHNWKLTLELEDMLSPNYKQNTSEGNSKSYQWNTAPRAYKGYLNASQGGHVRLTLHDNLIYGYITLGSEEYFIEPRWYFDQAAPLHQFVVYKRSDVKPLKGVWCGVTEMEEHQDLHQEVPETEKLDNCYILELAIASDFSMFQKYGSVANVEAHNVGVMNNVQGNYDDEFADEIDFDIVEQFVVTTSGGDPWTSSTNAGTLLDDFADWGPTGFDETHDLGQLWTNRDLNGGTIGIAYLDGLCTGNRYHVCQDFSSNANLLRVLTAHEIGHNLSAVHDPSGTWIMSPTVNSSTQWSPASIADINPFIASKAAPFGCLAECPPPVPPIPIFTANYNFLCTGSFVTFYDQSLNSPNSWSWSFPGAVPSTSTEQNPTVQYPNPGTYAVTLTVTNSIGSNSNTQNGFINVGPFGGIDFFFFENWEDGAVGWTIQNPDNDETWTVESVNGAVEGDLAMRMDNFNYDAPGQRDGLVSPAFDLSGRQNIELQIEYAYARYSAQFRDSLVVYVSTNGGVSFPTRIFAATENGSGNFATHPQTTSAFNPSVEDDWCYGGGFGANNCLSLSLDDFAGEPNVAIRLENVNDFGNRMYIDNIRIISDCQVLNPPIANFEANITQGCIPMQVNFTDLSENTPISWQWTFPGAIPPSSTLQNPSVAYITPGVYDVILTVANPAGVNTVVFEDYISVEGPPTADFDYDLNGQTATFTNNSSSNVDTYLWDFGDGETSTEASPVHEYDGNDAYIVTLTVTNECGTDQHIQVITVLIPPVAGFSAEPPTGCAPLTVQFTDNSSNNVEGWSWSFEGGTPATSNEQNPVVTFNDPGIFDVSLTVTNSAGQDMLTQNGLIIVDPAPVADFIVAVNGDTVHFTNNSNNAGSYFWDFGDNATSTEETPSHIYDTDGQYMVMLIATGDCGPDTSFQMVEILLPPVAGFSASNTTGCPGAFIQFADDSSENVESWSWEFEGGNPATSNLPNPGVTYDTPGTYSVTLTVSNSAGMDTYTETNYITIEPLPTASFGSTVNGSTVSFNNSSTEATEYNWDFGDGGTSNEVNPEHIYFQDGSYTVTLTAINDCGEVTTTQIVEIATPPTAGFSSDITSGCVDLEVQFMDNSSENTTGWLWTFEGGDPATSADPNPLVTYSNAGTFSVTLEVSNGVGMNTITMTDYITVEDVPTASFTSVVNDLTTDFTNTSIGATSYNWDFGDGSMSMEANPTYTYAEDGVYEVILSATNDCGTVTTTETITIITPPTAGFSSDLTTGCAPLTVQFLDASSENTTGWLWTFEGGDPATSTDPNPVVTFANAGTYSVTLEVTNDAGSNTFTQTDLILVEDVPAPSFTTNTTDNTVDFTNTSVGATSYEWDFGDGNTSTEINPSHTYAEDGIFIATLSATNDCGTVSTEVTVSINTPPVADFNADVVEGCVDLIVQFNDASTDNVTQWFWTFEGGNPATSTEANPQVTYNSPGVYDVTLEVTGAAGSNVITFEDFITVFPLPEADFSSVLNGLQADFTNSSTDAISFQWDFGDNNTSTEANPSHTYAEDGTYTVTLTATNDCGTVTTTETITIVTPPSAGFSADVTSGCADLVVQFSDNSSDNTTGWFWIFEGGTPATSTDPNPVVTYTSAGSYDVTLEVSNAAGNSVVLETAYVVVDDVPAAAFSSVVSGLEVAFTNASSNATSYEWDFGDNNTSTEAEPSHTYAEDGTYVVILNATNDCGTVTTTETIVIVTPPSAGFSADVTSGCADLTVQFTDESSDNTTAWEWIFEGGSPATSNDPNPIVTYSSPGIYAVTLTVTNAAGESTVEELSYIEVFALPTAGFDAQIDGTELTLQNTSSDYTSINWDFGDGGMSQEENPAYSYQEDGTYTVVLTLTNDCGTVSAEQTVVVVTPPSAGFSADLTIGCAPLTVQFNDQSSDNTTGWNWEFEGGLPATSTDPNPEVVYTTPGIYAVTLTVTNAAGESTVVENGYIEVLSLPTAGFNYTVGGLDVDFENTSLDGNSYLWNFGDDTISNEENPNHSYAEDGTYEVSLTVINDCGSVTFTETVVIATVGPVAFFEAETEDGCVPLTVQFVNQSSDNAQSFKWLFEGGDPTESTEENPSVTYTSAGSYDVTLIAINAFGSDTLVLEDYITVEEEATADFSFMINGTTVDFTNLSINADTYLWIFGDGESTTEANPTHQYDQLGTFQVMLIANNDCGGNSITLEVVIEALMPIASFKASPEEGCAPLTVQFEDESENEPTGWQWTFQGGDPATSTQQNPTVTYNTPGIYDVSLIVTNSAGSAQLVQSQYINVQDVPFGSFSYAENGLEVTFNNTSIGAASYAWDFGDGTSSSNPSPVHTYAAPGTYTVVMTVTNECGATVVEEVIQVAPTSVMEVGWLNAFEVYPNPNSGQFQLYLNGPTTPRQSLAIRLYSVVGQQLYLAEVEYVGGELQHRFDLRYLPKGMYVLEVANQASAVYKKVVID